MTSMHARASTAALILAGALATAGPAAAKSAPSTVKSDEVPAARAAGTAPG